MSLESSWPQCYHGSQGQNLCWMSLGFITVWRLVTSLSLLFDGCPLSTRLLSFPRHKLSIGISQLKVAKKEATIKMLCAIETHWTVNKHTPPKVHSIGYVTKSEDFPSYKKRTIKSKMTFNVRVIPLQAMDFSSVTTWNCIAHIFDGEDDKS